MRVAHVSDAHILNKDFRAGVSLGVRFLSLGRSVDARARIDRLRAVLASAKSAGADHVVFSGDLTETGAPEQFETLAEVLAGSGFTPDAFTLVPGNHDAYDSASGWRDALAGPLSDYRRGAAREPGKVVEVGDVVLLPVDVACHQPYTRSAGELDDVTAAALERRLGDPAFLRRSVVVVMHHPPSPHASRAWQWLDGLRGHERIMSMLVKHPNVTLMHGHLHSEVRRSVGSGPERVFGAPAVVDDASGEPRVRLYTFSADALATRAASRGFSGLAA